VALDHTFCRIGKLLPVRKLVMTYLIERMSMAMGT
jgi:hypothetical protein